MPSAPNTEPPPNCPEDVATVWREIVAAWGAKAPKIVGPQLEAYCGQVARLRDAQSRIAKHGLILEVDGKPTGPHPALAAERSAQIEIRLWGDHFRPN